MFPSEAAKKEIQHQVVFKVQLKKNNSNKLYAPPLIFVIIFCSLIYLFDLQIASVIHITTIKRP